MFVCAFCGSGCLLDNEGNGYFFVMVITVVVMEGGSNHCHTYGCLGGSRGGNGTGDGDCGLVLRIMMVAAKVVGLGVVVVMGWWCGCCWWRE